MTSEKQSRATYTDTKNNQKKLVKKIHELIRENRPLNDDDEREKMLDLINGSTLGIGTEQIQIRLPGKRTLNIDDFQHFIRCLIEYDFNIVTSDFLFEIIGETHRCINYNIEIKDLWKQLLFNLNHFFPKAIESSVRISKEIIDTKRKVRTIHTIVDRNGK